MTGRENIFIFGAGGHAKVIVDIVEKQELYSIAAVIDEAKAGSTFLGYRVHNEGIIAEMGLRAGLVAIGDNWTRAKIVDRLAARFPDLRFVTAVHPSAQIARDVHVGDGTVIMASCALNTATHIGQHVIVNTGSCVDHDNHIEDFASLAPGCVLGGNVRVGHHAALSLGAKVIHGLNIGAQTVVGAGSVVVRSIPESVVAYGVPCRVMRQRQPGDRYL